MSPGIFDKIIEKIDLDAKLIKELKETKDELKKTQDMYTENCTEMEKIKERYKRDKEEFQKYANESLIRDILPVADNLSKALTYAQNDKNLSTGLELVLKILITSLKNAGLQEVEAEGKLFDPNYHEAISQQPDDNIASGYVLKELQKGYTLNGHLVRPSLVIISEGKEPE